MDAHSPPTTARSDPTQQAKLKVFISYSRDDLCFADQLDAGLDLLSFDSVIDRHGIEAGEDWRSRLGGLIRNADTIVFVLSPDSAQSKICAWEVDEAARYGKRILPVLCRSIEGTDPPPRLKELNYIYFYEEPTMPGSGFGTGLARLAKALNTDLDWIREHTRLLARATEWETGDRPVNRLLYGADIAAAKDWAARRPKDAPEVSALHLDYIRASEAEAEKRSNAEQQRLAEMEAAQTERAHALSQAEDALKQATEEQKKRARIRNIAMVVVLLVAAAAVWQWRNAESQREIASLQSRKLDTLLYGASDLITTFDKRYKFGTEEADQVLQVFGEAADDGYVIGMYNVGWAHSVKKEYEQTKAWYEAAAAKESIGGMAGLGWLYEEGLGVPQDGEKALHWYMEAVKGGDIASMTSVGRIYGEGKGVKKDYAQAREWYEKASAEDDAIGMANLGRLYEGGLGVKQDFTKARFWYEKAAAGGNATGMASLAWLHLDGKGVPKNRDKAKEWFEKAAAKGEHSGEIGLRQIPIMEATDAGRYAEALGLQEKLADEVIAYETKEKGVLGFDSVNELNSISWLALFTGEFAKSLSAAERAYAISSASSVPLGNKAHALMFLDRQDEARAIYTAHLGKPMAEIDPRIWEDVVAQDFDELRKAGRTHPMMDDVERALGLTQ